MMSMNYLNEGKRYYKRRIQNIDESLLMKNESLVEYNDFLKNKVRELETKIELLKNKKNSYE
jgi:hypothetical protein